MLSFGLSVAALALTPPGTIILNRALILYQTADTEDTLQSISNATSVAVGHLYEFAVDNTHHLHVPAGVVAQFPHRVVNQGNTSDSYSFSFPGLDASSFITPVVYLDTNLNGKVDANEPAIDQTDELAPEETVDIVVTARVSHLLGSGQQIEFPFTVDSVKSDKSQGHIDKVTVGSPGELAMSLRTFPECNAPLFVGDLITHSVDGYNSGVGELESVSYVVDGEVAGGLVMELAIAANTVFYDIVDADNNTVDGTPVVQLEGFAANEWISTAQVTDPGLVLSVGYFIKSADLTSNQVAAFSARVQVLEPDISAPSILSTAIFDADADGVADRVSNSTCNTFSTFGALERGQLQFMQPAPDLMDSGQAPDFYTDSDFVNSQQYLLRRGVADPYSVTRDGMYLQLSITQENHPNIRMDSAGNRYVVAEVRSQLTDDYISVVLLETNSTGLYRSVAPIELSAGNRADGNTCPVYVNSENVAPRYEQVNSNCVLQSADNDQLLGRFGDSEVGFVVANVALVSRQSVVFDSKTLEPVAGALVQIRQALTDEIEMDPLTGVLFEFITDNNGNFTMPRLKEGTEYFLQVSAPVGYQFPSDVPPFRLTDYNVHNFSYGRDGFSSTPDGPDTVDGGVFVGASINAQLAIDIPLDPAAVGRLLAVDKIAAQTTVDVGQSVFYTVTVRNLANESLNEVLVTDTLPFGFRYVPGSTLLSGETTDDPQPSGDGDLLFQLGSMESNATVELSYAVRATAAAR